MNLIFERIKQRLFNNLRYGEQRRVLSSQIEAATDEQRALALTLLMPDPATAWGIDISHWNIPPVNLKRMRDEFGLMFVIIKGSDGTVESRYFREHVANAEALGLPWGIYDWLYPDNRVSINAQTTAWANQAKAFQPPMGVAIDVEQTKYMGQVANPTAADLDKAHDQLVAKYQLPLIYTSPGYAKSYLTGYNWSKAGDRLWMAHWGAETPTVPAGALGWQLHQFGILEGKKLDANGNYELDGNRFNGTRAAFAERYGGTVPEPPPTIPGENMIYNLTVNADGLNGRSSPFVSTTTLIYPGGFQRGDKLVANEPVLDANGITRWYPIMKQTRNGIVLDLPAIPTFASDGGNARYLEVDSVVPIPPVTTLPDIPYVHTTVIGGGDYEEHTHTISGVLKPKA